MGKKKKWHCSACLILCGRWIPGGTLSQKYEFIVLCTSFLSRQVHKWLLDRSYSPVGSRARKLWRAEPSTTKLWKKISFLCLRDWFLLKLVPWEVPLFSRWNDKEKLCKIWKPWQIFQNKCSLQKWICSKTQISDSLFILEVLLASVFDYLLMYDWVITKMLCESEDVKFWKIALWQLT